VSQRYVVGIDLGTTNCALALHDLSSDDEKAIAVQAIAQLV
jgi:molecular chaperone DnaK (HSP70)